MTVELRPLGVRCNIQCQYCYQNPQRDAGQLARSYDIDLMKAAIEAEGGPFALFGGEPLLVPEEDLETLWSWGLERFGYNTVQTNGTLINEAPKKTPVTTGPNALAIVRASAVTPAAAERSPTRRRS